MRLTIPKEELKEGVGIVEKIYQKTLTLPILQNILLKTEKNILKLSSTNLESGINWKGLAKIEKEGGICIPLKFFSNLLNLLPNKPIELEVNNLILNLKCNNYITQLKGFNPDDFPIIPILNEGDLIDIDNKEFCQSLSQILDIPSSSSVNPTISGIFLSFQNNLIKMVATDSFRLAEKKLFLKTNLSKEYSLILPQTSTKEIVNIFKERDDNLKIYFSPNQILLESSTNEFSQPEIQYTSKLIEGEYPNYQEVIPKKYQTQIQIKKDEFLNQIKTASLFSGKISEVKLKINPKKEEIEVLSKNSDLGEYKGYLKGNIKGKEIDISFNYRFLISGISEIEGNDLICELTDKEKPVIFKSLNRDDYFYVVMPIKTT